MKLHWQADFQTWEALAGTCPGRTFYHTAPYLEAASRASGRRFEAAICQFGPGEVALIPVIYAPRLGGLAAEGSVGGGGSDGAYGGLLSPGPLTPDQVDRAFGEVAKDLPNVRVLGNPFAPGPHMPGAGPGLAGLGGVTRVLACDRIVRTGHAERRGQLLWVANPPEHLADRFGALEAPERARPRAFYYHLFRLAAPRTLFLGLLEADNQTLGAVLVGRTGRRAYVLGLVARDGDTATLTRVLEHVPGLLPLDVSELDLGPGVPDAALPVGWNPVPRSFGAWAHSGLARKLLDTLRLAPRRAS